MNALQALVQKKALEQCRTACAIDAAEHPGERFVFAGKCNCMAFILHAQALIKAQLLKLEDAYEETRRAGTTLGDELKCAILLRCLSGAFKTHWNLSLKETSTYQELREEILRWDRAHQKLSNLVSATDDTTDPKPMEVDRIKARAKAMARAKGSPIRAIRRDNPSKRAKTKANQRTTMTKAANLEKGSQSKIQGKERDKVIEFAMFVESLATWPKTGGVL